jgi:hypothetical protein
VKRLAIWWRCLWHAVRGYRLEMSRAGIYGHDGEAYECSCGGAMVIREGNDMPWSVRGATCPVFVRWLDDKRRAAAAALPRARFLTKADRERLGR